MVDSRTKEEFINKVAEMLIGRFEIKDIEEIKSILVLELRNIKMQKEETALTVATDERASIIRKFIACKTVAGLTKRTIEAYCYELSRFFVEVNKNITEITSDDIRVYMAIKKQKGAKDISIDNVRRYLNSFFEWCLKEEIITKNPVKKIEKVKAEKIEKLAFTEMEIETMRTYLFNYSPKAREEIKEEVKLRNIAIFETFLSTGVRCTELINIKKEQFQENTDELIVLGKGKKERIVFLNAKAKIAIKNYLAKRDDDCEWLFISHEINNVKIRKQFTQAGVENMIRDIGKACKIKAYPHKFRRSMATNAVRKGMPIEQVKKILGHASLNTTQIYVNVSNEDVRNSHLKYCS